MIALLLVLLGLVLGSFVNAFVWRLHTKRDWVRERSECPHCHHVLGLFDLIPIVSWLLLRGRCRYCSYKIEDSPLVELALSVLFVISYWYWPVSVEGQGLFTFVLWILFLVGFLALTVYDLRWFLLPNKIVFPLIGLAVVQVVAACIYESSFQPIVPAAVGILVVAGIFYLLFQVSRGMWIGGGDVKLGIVLGALAGGLVEAFLLLFIASVAGMLASVPLLIQGKVHRKTQLPFGPFLIVGVIVVYLFGSRIIDWYVGLIYA